MSETYASGVLRQRWDDAARTYTEWNASGGQASQRAYTTQENADADARAAAQVLATNETTVTDDLAASLATLKALIGETTDPAGTTSLRAIKNQTNATINANPATYVKALADGMITLARNQRKQVRAEIRDFTGAD